MAKFGSEKGFAECDKNGDGVVSFDEMSEHHLTWSQWLFAIVLYLPTLCLLGSITIIDSIANSVPPGENILGFSSLTLTLVTALVAPVLCLVKAYALPLVTDITIRVVTGSTDEFRSARMAFIGSARTFLTIVVPCTATFLMSTNCLGFWLYLWTPCQTPSQFDANANLPWSLTKSTGSVSFNVLSSSSICGSNYRMSTTNSKQI